MKVFDLGCEAGHAFEGWFGSEGDYDSQRERGLLECPLCGSRQVQRRLSAPRLNLKTAGRREAPEPAVPVTEPAAAGANAVMAPSPEARATVALMQEAWMRAVRHVMSNTEDVGERFADEARRIHYGESPERGIRGQTTGEERAALQEEGIEVMPLPLPKGLTGPLQ